jgi:hypothetical protein
LVAVPGNGKTVPVADTEWQLRVETCRIELWRGYVTSSFVARSAEGDGAAVAEASPAFRWRGKRAPDSEEAKLAHYELLKRLKDDGWSETDGRGEEWYELELARPTMVPRSEPEPVDEEPEPREQTPEPVVVESPPLPPPRPAPVLAEVAPLPAAAPRQRDAWRLTAAIALVAALFFLLLLVLH